MIFTNQNFRNLILAMLISTSFANAQTNGQPSDREELSKVILYQDSIFWVAYNVCDVEKMMTFFSDDIEFYHDKGGLTTSLPSFRTAVENGLCGKPDWRLRREAIQGSLKVFPLNNYGAILSGDHVFYIIENGNPGRLDGQAKFTHVWRFKDKAWKMHRVLSYDHGPAKK